MKIRVLLIICIFITPWITGRYSVYSQDFDNYRYLKSSGNVPDDFTGSSVEKYKNDTKSHYHSDTISESVRKNYYLERHFSMDRILRSGFILFNDPLAEYVQKVVDYLLADRPDLRKELRFYTLKSPEVNAFATGQGIFFVSVGLLAQLQNEAQLAYILSHEIAHYTKEHSIKGYVATDEILSAKGSTKDLRLSHIYSYSKEHEKEADEAGLKDIYIKTDYSLAEVSTIFDVLLYSYLPIEEIDFEKTFFETPHYTFPEEYMPEQASPITAVEDYDDSKSTHPNIKKRRDAIHRLLDLQPEKTGKQFIVGSKEEFLNIRRIARFELCNIYLLDRQYEDAIYCAYSLMKKDSLETNKYLRTIIGKGLYGLSKYNNLMAYSQVQTKPSKVEGSKHDMHFFFNEISRKELNVLATSYLWNLRKDYPEDSSLFEISDDILKDVVYINNLTLDLFNTKAKDDATAIADSVSDEEFAKMDKYEKIKYKRNVQSDKKKSDNIFSYAFVDLFKYSPFYDTLHGFETQYNLEKGKEETSVSRSALKNKKRQEERFGKKMGIEKMLVINPFVVFEQESYSKDIDYISSEKTKILFMQTMAEMSTKIGLETIILDNKVFNPSDIDLFNDYNLISNWFYEHSEHDTYSVFHSITPEIKEIVLKHNTRYVALPFLIKTRVGNESQMARFFCYSASLFGIPVGAYYLVKKDFRFHFGIFVYDITTGERVFESYTELKENYHEDIFKSLMYDVLYQINNK